MGINKYNAEGYYDPTTYKALTNIHREKARKCNVKSFKPLVFICSPLAGDIDGNTKRTLKYCRFAVESNAIPLAPHLLYPTFTDDSVPEQRETGIACGLAYMECCDEVWAFTGNGISSGMRMELDRAGQLGKPILEIAEV